MNGPAFAAGWVLGLTAVSVLVVLLSNAASDPNSEVATGVSWVKLAFSGVLLVLAAKQWKKRPKKGEEPTLPKWMDTIASVSAGKAFDLGLLLSAANPKNVALTAVAAASIAEAGLSAGDDIVAIAVFVLLGSLSVLGARWGS